MECPNCHHWNEAGSKFCEECGYELSATSEPAPVSISTSVATAPPASLPELQVPDPTPQTLIPPDPANAAATTGSIANYTGPRLVLNSTGSVFKLGDSTIMGREDPTLQIDFDGYPDAKYISHRHAQVVKNNGQFYIEDLGSSNHTWVNGIKMSPGQSEPLHNGDKVRVGKIEMLFYES